MDTSKIIFAILVAMAIISCSLWSSILLHQHHSQPYQFHTIYSDMPLKANPWLKHFSMSSRADKQNDQLVCSIAISNKGTTILFTTGFREDKGKFSSCTVNNIEVPGRRISADVFECGKTISLNEDDVLSIRLSDSAILPSLAIWSDRIPLSRGDHPKIPVCIMTMMMNEEGKISDWTEYYIRQGVGLFLVYNNNSTDNTLLELQKYPQVVVVDWPWKKTKNAAIFHGFLHMKEACEWVFHIDVDEYIFPSADNASFTLKEIMYKFPKWVNRPKIAPAIAVVDQVCLESKLMGTSGYIHCPNLSVAEAYIDLDQGQHVHPKCADRPNQLLTMKTGCHFRHVQGETVFLKRKAAHVVHYKYQCLDYYITKYDKGRPSAYVQEWDKSKLNRSKLVEHWTKPSGTLDTAFRDYKRIVDKWPLVSKVELTGLAYQRCPYHPALFK